MVYRNNIQLTVANKNSDVKAIVLEGAGKTFIAGADIQYFIRKIEQNRVDDIYKFTKYGHSVLNKIDGSDNSNGSGKTSIVRAMNYALYGDATSEADKNTRSLQVKGDHLIYNNAEELEVNFLFEVNNDDYRIRRVLKRGSTASVYISKNEGKEKKYKIKDAQEFIEKLLGANYDIFKNTSYFQQGDLMHSMVIKCHRYLM